MVLARLMQKAAAGAGSIITFQDNFNRTDGALGADWSRLSLGSNATVEVVSNTARTAGSTGSEAWYRYEKSVGGNDIVVEADLTTPASGTYYSGLLARVADTGAYGYRFVVNSSNVELCRDGNEGGSAYSGGGGNSTHLGSSPDPFYTAASTTYHLKLRITDVQTGTRVRAYVDNMLVYDEIDTSASRHTTGTRGGIYTYVSPTSTVVQWDNFSVSSAPAEESYPTGTTQSDDFAGASLSSFWIEQDPLNDCTPSVGSGILTLTVPTRVGLDHDDWASARPINRALRIMQPVLDSNWTVDTKILNADAHTNRFAGIRIESDFNNYLRCDWDGDGANINFYVSICTNSGHTQQYNGAVTAGATQWMRVNKNGTTYTFYSSNNGTDWTQRAQFTWTPTPKLIGLCAGSSSAGVSYAAQFEYFTYS